MKFKRILFLLLIFALTNISSGQEQTLTSRQEERFNEFFSKERVTILITDSGLGGISVLAEMDKLFQQFHPFKEVDLYFVNALAGRHLLYNRMANDSEKIRVFNNALNGMDEQFKPDLIIIACNTLSVLYERTPFYKKTNLPVLTMVEFATDLMYKQLKAAPASKMIILGTPTTITQNTYKTALSHLGIPESRLINQSCPMLETEIQAEPNSDMVSTMIEMFAGEVMEQDTAARSDEIALGLCCTHYPYVASTFADVFARVSGKKTIVLDPNQSISRYLFEHTQPTRYKKTKIAVQVISQAELAQQDIDSIAGLIEKTSPPTATALKNYQWRKKLFSF